jgi:two-component system cell cycle sensor histidine kinase/response regulator CckA
MTGSKLADLAHELNQPLNTIRMAAENALERLRSGRADTAYLENKLAAIVDQTVRAAELVRELRQQQSER